MIRSTPSIGTVMSQLTLVSHHCAHMSRRAAIALLEKGVPFRRVMVASPPSRTGSRHLAARARYLCCGCPIGRWRSDPVRERRHLRVHRGDAARPGAASQRPARAGTSSRLDGVRLGNSRRHLGPRDRDRRRSFETKRRAPAADKLARVELVLADRPILRRQRLQPGRRRVCADLPLLRPVRRLVDAGVFAHDARYVRGGRCSAQACERTAGGRGADYQDRLRTFLAWHDAHLLQLQPPEDAVSQPSPGRPSSSPGSGRCVSSASRS